MGKLFNPGLLREFMKETFVKAGIPEKDAEITSDILLKADLRGIESHGIARLPIYLKRIELGIINSNPNIKIQNESNGSALLDADNGLGQVATYKAMQICIQKAKENGVASVGIQHSNHFGIGAYYSLMAADEDLIGFICTNASPMVAPFGGKNKLLGTNPFSITVPAKKYPHVCLDMATTVVPRGKLEISLREGKSIPLTWATDAEGKPTDDPALGLKGTLLPLGGPKGYGLALIIDILSGILVSTSYGKHIGTLFNDLDKPQDIGHFVMAINPNSFLNIEIFKERIDDMIDEIKGSEKAAGVSQLFLPGEIEHKNEQTKESGISLNENVIKELSIINKELLDNKFDL